MPPALKTVLREPFLHFALIGVALFALDAATSDAPADRGEVEPERRLVLDAAARDELVRELTERAGRPPTDEERAEAIDRWIDEEILYREGRIRGLDEDDPAVRGRVAASMERTLLASAPTPAPSDEDLRAYFEAHRERWARPARVSFTHVFVEGHDADAEARAASILERLRGGGSPDGLGDTFSGGRHYRGRRAADLAETFGAGFADGLATQEPGRWVERRSRFGLHLVRVDRTTEASAADFADARDEVRRAWEEARRREALDRAIEALRARWEIVER